MAHSPQDFGPALRLEADAVGPPGQRTFRLLVTNCEGAASLWLEKEELQALGIAIDQLLARLSSRSQWKYYGTPVEPFKPAEDFPSHPLVELKVGQLSLGYEGESRTFVLMVHDPEDDPEGPATFTCTATATQMRRLGRQIAAVIAAGRPRCPLCGDPLEPEGHQCVRAN